MGQYGEKQELPRGCGEKLTHGEESKKNDGLKLKYDSL